MKSFTITKMTGCGFGRFDISAVSYRPAEKRWTLVDNGGFRPTVYRNISKHQVRELIQKLS